MKKYVKKGFIALALIFTLVGIQTLKNNKIGAYAPIESLTEFNTPNIFTEMQISSYQDLQDGPYTTFFGKVFDNVNDIYQGYSINLLNYYILNLNGLQQYVDDIVFIPIENGQLNTSSALQLVVDKNSSQQVLSFAQITGITEVSSMEVELIIMFSTPNELGKITVEMLQNMNIGLYNYNAELLYEQPIDKDGLNAIFDLINRPIDDLLNYIGIDDTIILSPGFGSITWFEITLRQAIKLVIGLLIGLWFIKFLLRLIKKFFSIIFGGFTI